MAHRTDAEIIATTHNTARFFTEHRHVAWVLLIATLLWGLYSYKSMPQRKDPDIPVRVAVATCPWPGVGAREVEQLITRPIEQTMAQNSTIHPNTPTDFGIKSLTLPGVAIVFVQLAENITDPKKQFSDINLKLEALNNHLPQGAGPIQFQSDFGDTAALMLTVASPPADAVEVALRARSIEQAIEQARREHTESPGAPRVSVVYCFPQSVAENAVRRPFELFAAQAAADGIIRNGRVSGGPGFVMLDGVSSHTDAEIQAYGDEFIRRRLHASEIHPDAWRAAMIRDPRDTQTRLAAVAGDKYSYRDLDDFTDLIGRTVLGAPQASKVSRSGVLPERVYLDYSQERLASYGLQPSNLSNILNARNISPAGGAIEVDRRDVIVHPSGQFESAEALGGVMVGTSPSGSPLYLRDLVDISRGYQSPPQFLNFYTWRDDHGAWHRSRAVTLAIYMRSGEQIRQFGVSVDEKLAAARQLLPKDLIVARTSDQPRQAEESIDLFMDALYEAILLVILVSLLGFWDWRSAALMALAIPITLALTFAMTYALRIDLQQVSIATLIIALGLLVDDPVVAGDSIKRSLAEGHPGVIAGWLGPTKLAKAIMYATVTNIVAYLPFLMLNGTTGEFLYSLPIVMTCALVASRLVSMTFIPLLGYYLLRPAKSETPLEERRRRGFTGFYYRIAGWSVEHRWRVFAGSILFLAAGGYLAGHLKQQFFPDDVQYWSYLDVWLPNDTPLATTNQTVLRVEDLVRDAVERYGREHPGENGKPRELLQSLTTFAGGGGPRFWFSVNPELQQQNYAQVIIQISSKEDTPELVGPIQEAVSRIPGARVDMHQLQTNPVNPVDILISGQADVGAGDEQADILVLRRIAKQVEDILRSNPNAARVHNDWGAESATMRLNIDTDRANLAGVTNLDVARSTATALSGSVVTSLREGNKQIPVVARLRMEERGQLSDLRNLYVYSSQGAERVPLLAISSLKAAMETERIRRQNHFRTITVECFPVPGGLTADAIMPVLPKLTALQKSLPPGYKLEIGGERAKQQEGFKNLAVVMAISIASIYLALLLQFNNALKPLLVFAAAPYGIVGAMIALSLMNTPFGFMAFLGIASLIGVIVSHVIVLFDFIEEMHEKGEPLREALLDAGIVRLRPVMITVGATVLALFPLALHGGPLWKPLCYTQIGGLTIATFVTLLLVPVLYSIVVIDLKWLRWE